MNKLRVLTLLFAACIITFLSSCNKDDDNEPQLSKTELLTAGIWKGDAVYFSGKDITKEHYEGYDALTFHFKKDGSYIQYDEGEEVSSGKWELSKDEKNIIQDKGTEDEYTLAIKKLTSTALYFETEDVVSDEMKGMVEYRFKR